MIFLITFRVKLTPSPCSHYATPVRERLIYWGHCGYTLDNVQYEASRIIGCKPEDLSFSEYNYQYYTEEKYVLREYNNFIVYAFDTEEKFNKFVKHHRPEWKIRDFNDYFGFIDDNRSDY